ncbi:MAG: Mrp/NBP35 family ATP-binding protein [Gemmatimonadota bacterium]|nr:Mrp/NBP35 family ATP-binding protein [Gemmatimonadota bacterium]
MSEEYIREAVLSVLSDIKHPTTGRDVVESGQVEDLSVTEDGDVRFSFRIQADDPKGLVRKVRATVEAIEVVTSVKVNVQLPQSGQAPLPDDRETSSIPGRGPGSVPAPTPKSGILSEGTKVVAVSSGKGGVGKSMVATNLAAALAARGQVVGLLDADIYGPNIPLMFGVEGRPAVTGAKGQEMIEPMEAHGVRLMSLGFLLDKEQPAIMRGPLISGILKQFLEQVSWGELDAMVVDMPPGTGDAQLSLVQTIDLDGVVMVSTPQDVATGDVRRGIKMFERVNTRVFGLVENMSGLVCPHCSEVVDVFGSGGGDRLAEEMDLPLLGRVPLDPAVRSAGDEGAPTVISAPDSGAGQALRKLADVVSEMLVTGQ